MRRAGGPLLPSVVCRLSSGGRERSYRLYRPGSVEAGTPAPLVVVLHGGYGSAGQAEQAYGWDELADRHGFLVAYPDGVGRSWNAGWCCGPAHLQDVDDVGFVGALVADIAAGGSVDPRRVFAAGVSNGAMLAYRIACESPGLLTAIGAVAGTMVCECPEPRPVSVLHIHGLEDRNVPFWGGVGPKAADRRQRPSVPSVIQFWRTGGGCGRPAVDDDGQVRRELAAGPGGIEVALVTLAGVGHVWPGSRPPSPRVSAMLDLDPPSNVIDATGELWSFFAAHPGLWA
ncbi:MAG TPA: PHB depolymerase family esterase [Actinomycetota bacterium]